MSGPDQTVRWGLVGCGDIAAKRVAAALREAPHSSLVAVARARAELAAEFAQRHGARRWHADWRGLLRDGFKADIVVFNPKTVKTHATREDPKHYPVGIDYVIVNGIVVIDQGQNTGALPGRALRRGHAST